MKHRRWSLRASLLIFVFTWNVHSQEVVGAESPKEIRMASSGKIGMLYDPEDPSNLPGGEPIGSIVYAVSNGRYVHVALRSLGGEERIDTWDLSDPSHPVFEHSLHFGNILEDGVRFTPMTMVVVPGGLLVQTSEGWHRYRHVPGEGFTDPVNITVPGTGLGADNSQLHMAGRYGSFLQQIRSVGEMGNADSLLGEVLVDFSDADDPFLHWSPTVPGQTFDHPINAQWNGMPGSLWYDPMEQEASFQIAKPELERHLDSFWNPRLGQVFHRASMNQSLGYLIDATLERIPLESLQAELLQHVIRNMHSPDVTMTARILMEEAAGRRLVDVLRDRGISLDDPLGLALEKLVIAQLSTDLETEMSTMLFEPVMQEWLKTIFLVGDSIESAADLRNQIGNVLNTAMDQSGLAQYIALELLGPLFGDPAFLNWTLNDLIVAIERSDVGTSLNIMLRTADGFGAVSGLLDLIDDGLGLLEELLGVEIPSLPACARFPTTTRALMELALFSWNDPANGLSLDRDGLAWMELMKFYQYLQGNHDFDSFLASLDEAFRSWHQAYAGEIVQQFAPWMNGDMNWDLSLSEWSRLAAAEIPVRKLTAQWMVNGFLKRIDVDQTLSLNAPLRKAFETWDLSVDQLGLPEATIDQLNAKLQLHGAEEWNLRELVASVPQEIPLSDWKGDVFQSLRAQMFAQFGVSNPDLPLRRMLEHFLTQHANFDGLLGRSLDDAFGDFLRDVSLVGQWLHTFDRAGQGDCIAQWQVALKAIAASSIAVDGGAAAAAMDAALTAAYEGAVDWALQSLLGLWAEEVIGSFGGEHRKSLATRWSRETWTFDLHSMVSVENAATTTVGGGVGRDRVAFVLEHRFENDWFGPRSVELLTFHPANPADTLQRWDLGQWTRVENVIYTEDILWIAGTHYGPVDGRFPNDHAMAIRLDTAEPLGIRYAGSEHILFAAAEKVVTARHGSVLAVITGNRIILTPNPASESTSEPWQRRRPVWVDWLPDKHSLREGETWSFPAHVAGTFPIVFQLWRDGQLIAENQDGHFNLPEVGPDMGGEYILEAINEAGSIQSPPFFLDIRSLPRISIALGDAGSLRLGMAHAPVNRTYQLERTRDLLQWQSVEEGRVVSEKMTFQFQDALLDPSWFYRVIFEDE
ncbi:MAG: hypothetical protein ACFHW5_00555 [Verrucomicrobiota bacterium]